MGKRFFFFSGNSGTYLRTRGPEGSGPPDVSQPQMERRSLFTRLHVGGREETWVRTTPVCTVTPPTGRSSGLESRRRGPSRPGRGRGDRRGEPERGTTDPRARTGVRGEIGSADLPGRLLFGPLDVPDPGVVLASRPLHATRPLGQRTEGSERGSDEGRLSLGAFPSVLRTQGGATCPGLFQGSGLEVGCVWCPGLRSFKVWT